MEVVIVGQAPSRESTVPFEGRCGARLAEWAGFASWDDLNACFALTNLLPDWPGEGAGKGDAFPLEPARESADRLMEEVLLPESWDLVVMAGWNVAKAFRVWGGIPYLAPFDLLPDELHGERKPLDGVVIPHPSGVNRWLNHADNLERLRTFMRILSW